MRELHDGFSTAEPRTVPRLLIGATARPRAATRGISSTDRSPHPSRMAVPGCYLPLDVT
ncbi:hypothetical protein [Streptomyces hydrogenans]|uniref:hypothetical protein n=1 Tax=Streptomyces hydrogenans TaxID=1873719 RepID=UPI00278C8C89|nr:hypothetical protein [Streptomyces hydrogenans]